MARQDQLAMSAMSLLAASMRRRIQFHAIMMGITSDEMFIFGLMSSPIKI
jgi:hypothetical protein